MGNERRPFTLETLTIDPLRRRERRVAARISRNGACRLMSITVAHCSSVVFSTEPPAMIPGGVDQRRQRPEVLEARRDDLVGRLAAP